MNSRKMYGPKDVNLTFTVSPDLDIMGFYKISSEVNEGHPLYPQFVEALTRINISIPSTGLHKIQKEEIQRQVLKFYTTKAQNIERHCEQTHKQWVQCKSQFLDTCNALFSHKVFIEDTEFIAYSTLWRVCIQQIEQHAFSFPFVEDTHDSHEALYVVIHELLHVFFYQYANTVSDLKNRGDLWDIAEIFNGIVLSQNNFNVFYPSHTVTTYPAHKDVIKKIIVSGINDSDNADTIIARIIVCLGVQ